MTALDLLIRGGFVMWVLLALSVVSLALILYKLVQFRLARLGTSKVLDNLEQRLRSEDPHRLQQQLADARSPLAHLAARAITLCEEGSLSEEAIKAELERSAAEEVRRLDLHLKTLANLAHIAPLLGLLGTVTGMIGAFHSLEAAGMKVNPSLLAGGIWEALLTTAFGLSIAIPTMAAYAFLDGKVDDAVAKMHDAAARVLVHYARRAAADFPQKLSAVAAKMSVYAN
ncbi:MAG: MotA/TolQ/ExbB proton channel family protein [Bdellovibrionales bacterium]|nr:MotA/TolQ/ExbB proton channel family protein [Bdellovibrionales bacterium]